MKLSVFLVACFLLLNLGGQEAERNPDSPSALRRECGTAIRENPGSALEVCRRYLAHSDGDDQRAVNAIREWVAGCDRVRPYTKALLALTTDPNRAWFIYEPDLSLEIPPVVEKDGNYKVELERSFNGPAEEQLLRTAEAVYDSPIKMVESVLRNARWWAEHLPADNEPLWWTGGNDNMRLTTVVTARAVRHYYDLCLALRRDPRFEGFTMDHTSLVYRGSIKHWETYSHAADKFSDVYVADLNLEWGHSCGGLCGMGFDRNKVVVLSASGEVLAMYLDAPVNSTFTVS
jgi:hypothetical protein